VVAQLLFLESENPDKDISFYINSPGGSVSAGMSIYDTMQFIKPDVSTLCWVCGQHGRFLLAAGAKGKRFSLPNSKIMIHQPSGRRAGPGHRHRDPGARHPQDPEQLNRILAERTGQPLEKVEARHRARLLPDADEAKDYGLIDQVIPSALTSAQRRLKRRFLAQEDAVFIWLSSRELSVTRHCPHGREKRLFQRKNPVLLLLRQEPARSEEADRRPVGFHLRRVHRPVQRHHPR
jgi:ATP-dependent Clp protease protease subunit